MAKRKSLPHKFLIVMGWSLVVDCLDTIRVVFFITFLNCTHKLPLSNNSLRLTQVNFALPSIFGENTKNTLPLLFPDLGTPSSKNAMRPFVTKRISVAYSTALANHLTDGSAITSITEPIPLLACSIALSTQGVM